MIISEVSRTEEARSAREIAPEPYQFRIDATCPPTHSVIIRPGNMNRNATYWFWVDYDVQTPMMTIDFSDLGDTIAAEEDGSDLLTCTFANAYWYIGLVLGFNYEYIQERDTDPDWLPVFLYCGGQTEYETALEAEAEIDLLLNGTFQVSQWDRQCLWSFVLRNNGTVGLAGQIQPIDPLNRGRSYLYRDARERYPMIA
jgi:hypothetical protein